MEKIEVKAKDPKELDLLKILPEGNDRDNLKALYDTAKFNLESYNSNLERIKHLESVLCMKYLSIYFADSSPFLDHAISIIPASINSRPNNTKSRARA